MALVLPVPVSPVTKKVVSGFIHLQPKTECFLGPVLLHILLQTSDVEWPRLRRLLPFLYASSVSFVAMAAPKNTPDNMKRSETRK